MYADDNNGRFPTHLIGSSEWRQQLRLHNPSKNLGYHPELAGYGALTIPRRADIPDRGCKAAVAGGPFRSSRIWL
jgi:hypothetical protein